MTKTFTAEVTNGRLCFSESLAAFEGSTVRVSIEPATQPHDEPATGAEADIEVENDVYAPFVWKRMEVLGKAVIDDRGKLAPSGVMPEVERDG